ncbi:uncharacterized protein LOC107042583 [Diachasma alloeum]|uniref:uncharacterized protein LOC107042583 n=1 Tax=Diachasma alloeum TaxID=454923 RepID=UPI0007381CEE|nr:uncharacterized protein LOC107042583 [Diachasma alloeum]
MSIVQTSTPVAGKKRERTQNWVPEEKRELFTLIKAHINAIENKKIDTSATALKSLAWRQIYCDFKGIFSTERDITRMREQWRRMKAQARVDINTFAEKVRTVGLQEASKSRPPALSVDVWRLLQVLKKNESEPTSDDSQDADPTSNLQEILDNLCPNPLENSFDSIKQECISEFNDDDPSVQSSFASSPPPEKTRGVRLSEEEPMNLAHQKKMRLSQECSGDEDEEEPTLMPDYSSESIKRGSSLDISAEERNMKLKILGLELERAELKKQTAVYELRTSEIRKQLVESQAIDYFR